ncbi:hypothetical protein D3C78_18160 [compost metagenome]
MSEVLTSIEKAISKKYASDVEVRFGDTVSEKSKIRLALGGEEVIIPLVHSAESAVEAARRYLSTQVPIGNPMRFSRFQEAFFKIEILEDSKSVYAIVVFTDRASHFEKALYVRWNGSEWVKADAKLQVFEKIRILHGRENIGSIQIEAGSQYLVNPRARHEDNIVQIPITLRTANEIKNVQMISEEPYKVVLEVQRIAIVPTQEGPQLHMHWRRFTISKTDNKPIRIGQEELEIPAEWAEAFKGELDFEVNPVNTAVHDLIQDCQPQYSGDKFFLTHSGQCWVKSENSWIPVHRDYLEHYLNLEDIANEKLMYDMFSKMEL